MSKKDEVKKVSEEVFSAGGFIKSVSDLFNIISSKTLLSEYTQAPRNLVINAYKGLIFACIDVRSEAISTVKWKLKKNGEEVDEKDYIFKLLKNPNPLFTWNSFMYLFNAYYDLFGEVFIYIARSRRLGNIPVELWILPSQYVKVVYDLKKSNVISHYELMYVSNSDSTSREIKVKFKPNEIVYYKFPNPKNPSRGIGRLELALLETDIHNLAKTYVRNFYKNGAIPQGILSTEKSLREEEIERLMKLWQDKYGSVKNAWKVAILFGGLKFEKISIDPASQDFITQAKWSRDDILSIFKVPPVMLGVDVNSRATAEVQEKLFARQVVKPAIYKLEEFINYKLLPMLTKENYKIEFENPVPQDEELNVQKARVSSTFGVATINEVRQFLGLPPIDDEIGDQLVEPLNNPQGRPPKNEQNDAQKEILDLISQIERGIEGIDY